MVNVATAEEAPADLGVLENVKDRGAFFTPPAIAEYLARWAIGKNAHARILDPTCGDGAFLVQAGQELLRRGSERSQLAEQIVGVDIHGPTIRDAAKRLFADGLGAELLESDFFAITPPGQLFDSMPAFDAVIGNPPFIRYQQHVGEARKNSAEAALRQGVRLSGLASSWAAILVHAAAFLGPDGRLAMVMPAELLSVGYAEPIRQWLRRRFAAVKLVVFERLQFDDALENVVLLLARGSGGCDAFSLYYVESADDLLAIEPFDESAVALAGTGKWTDFFLGTDNRRLFREVVADHFAPLETLGNLALGTVTGANSYFALTETTRTNFRLVPGSHVIPISPPGTRHLKDLAFSQSDWRRLRDDGESVWLLYPTDLEDAEGFQRYLAEGRTLGVPNAYKCRVRPIWYRPPLAQIPDLFFTYMSHRFPRLIANTARTAYLNSMHGITLRTGVDVVAREALPLLSMNSVTMLGAELHGRSYGGGILKMEPSEAAQLPVPRLDRLAEAWSVLRPERSRLNHQLEDGRWTGVVARVDEVLLGQVAEIPPNKISALHDAAQELRARRLARGEAK